MRQVPICFLLVWLASWVPISTCRKLPETIGVVRGQRKDVPDYRFAVGLPLDVEEFHVFVIERTSSATHCKPVVGELCFAKNNLTFAKPGCDKDKPQAVFEKIDVKLRGKIMKKSALCRSKIVCIMDYIVDLRAKEGELADDREGNPYAPIVRFQDGNAFRVVSFWFESDPNEPVCWPEVNFAHKDAVDMTQDMIDTWGGVLFLHPDRYIVEYPTPPTTTPSPEALNSSTTPGSLDPFEGLVEPTNGKNPSESNSTAFRSSSEDNSKSSGLNYQTRWVIAGSVAVVMFILLSNSLFCGIWYIRKKFKKSKEKNAAGLPSKVQSSIEPGPSSGAQSRIESETESKGSQGKQPNVKSKEQKSKDSQPTQNSSESKESRESKELLQSTDTQGTSVFNSADDQYESFTVLGKFVPPPPAPV